MEVKAVPSGTVLSIVTGYLVTPDGIDAVCEVLNWMTGEPVYAHQIPRVRREAASVVLTAHPELADARTEAKSVNRENWQEWHVRWASRYGETIDVPRLTADQHERIDPVSEIVEQLPPDCIFVLRE